jgi:hypothetical protein
VTFVMSVFTCSKDEDEDTDPEKKADQEQPNQMAHPTAERLDVLLCLLLSYIEDVCRVHGNLQGALRMIQRVRYNTFRASVIV